MSNMLTNRFMAVSRSSAALSFRILSTSAALTQSEHQTSVTVHSERTPRTFSPLIHIEGFQGKTDFIPPCTAKSILSSAIQHSKDDKSIQGIQGLPQSSNFSVRSFHTNNSQIYQAKLNIDIEGDSSVQGIQGEECENFKLWMESCRRYGLENCDQQLQGIQTGRKTLAEVLAEQDELIRSIAEKYHQESSDYNQANCSVQGLQGWSQFPSVNSPCPQGVQGEDCVRFKLWLENCHRFGFSECMDQLENMSAGRKSLGQVLAEQDQLIRSVVDQHKQRRSYSTSASDPKSDPQVGGNSDTKLTQREQLKRAVKEYGATVIVFHIGISLMSLGGFYLAVSSGIDVIGILKNLGVGASILESKAVAGAGTFVVAYAVHKVFAPVRIGITLTSTPFIVRHLRKIGFLKPPKPQNVSK